jgi:glycopeptide antibiotics resistance protein
MKCKLGHPFRGSVLPVHTWIIEFGYAIVFFAGLTFVFAAPFISRQYSRFGRFAGWPALMAAAVVLYASALVAFTLFPFPNFAGGFCAKHEGTSHWQLQPFASLDDVTAHASNHTFVQTLTSGVFLQALMNVIFFVPLGFFLAYRSRRSLPTTTLVAFVVSLSIELTQGTGLWGLAPCPYRLADVDDLLTNTGGAILGWFLAVAIRRWLPDPAPERQPDPGPPGMVRDGVGVLLDAYTFIFTVVVLTLGLRFVGIDLAVNSVVFGASGLVVSLLLFVLVPAMRKDRAGPGVASVHLELVDAAAPATPAARWTLVVRWLLRWLPVAFFGLWWLAFIIILDFLLAGFSPSRRSLSMRLTRTTYATREQVVGANRSESVSPTP